MSQTFDQIKTDITSNDVVVYMKGNEKFPMCGFSGTVVQILKTLGVEFKAIDVLQDAELREGIKAFTNWPTIPQLYIKGEFIGGCDIVREMYQAGELQTLLSEKGIAFTA
ncbi:MAG: monothiol glutaredoxin, Grx4 family [Alphaproteobacteria bacterium 41-28]|nr:MAG: monothiol glutaredoxin, Grx4 family [Alphaproteobacteria bacterium 41-28]